MFANTGLRVTSQRHYAKTRLHVMLQRHDAISTLIAIQCNALCANCRFLQTGLVDHIGVLQTPNTNAKLMI